LVEDKKHNDRLRVVADERRHPGVRVLARACIALARLRLEKAAQDQHAAREAGTAQDEDTGTSATAAPRGTRHGR
jgi:hypothetical protein